MDSIFNSTGNKHSSALSRPSGEGSAPTKFAPSGFVDVAVDGDGVIHAANTVKSHALVDPFATAEVAEYSEGSEFIEGLLKAGLGGLPRGAVVLFGSGGGVGPKGDGAVGAGWVECGDGDRWIDLPDGGTWVVPGISSPPGLTYYQKII